MLTGIDGRRHGVHQERRTVMRRFVLAGCCFMVMVTAVGASAVRTAAAAPKGVPANAQEARVWGYVDGETFKARIGDKTEIVTLLGVDAPDDKEKECFAAESTAHLRELLPKKATIYLERDRDDRDGQDRLPRFVWIARDGDAKAFLVNTKQVRDGYAKLGTAAPTGRYADNLAKADQQAQDAVRGLWGTCYAPNGDWVGATTNGDPISFTVKNHGLSSLSVSITCANGSGYSTYTGRTTWKVPQPLDRDAFAITTGGGGTTITLAGSFLSSSEAQGTLELADSSGHCGGLVTTSWSATRQ
jgi:endonuclease YncB( thermonuclease family)